MGAEVAGWSISSISVPRHSAISQRLAKDDLPFGLACIDDRDAQRRRDATDL